MGRQSERERERDRKRGRERKRDRERERERDGEREKERERERAFSESPRCSETIVDRLDGRDRRERESLSACVLSLSQHDSPITRSLYDDIIIIVV